MMLGELVEGYGGGGQVVGTPLMEAGLMSMHASARDLGSPVCMVIVDKVLDRLGVPAFGAEHAVYVVVSLPSRGLVNRHPPDSQKRPSPGAIPMGSPRCRKHPLCARGQSESDVF